MTKLSKEKRRNSSLVKKKSFKELATGLNIIKILISYLESN